MTPLPYDYARCVGVQHPDCRYCQRREPGDADGQWHMTPPAAALMGRCPERLPS
jgi:hypothetical protein